MLILCKCSLNLPCFIKNAPEIHFDGFVKRIFILKSIFFLGNFKEFNPEKVINITPMASFCIHPFEI